MEINLNIKYNSQYNLLPPEHQTAREMAEIKKRLGDYEVTKTEFGYCVHTEKGEIWVEVIYLPVQEEHFCGPARFELVFHEPSVSDNRF